MEKVFSDQPEPVSRNLRAYTEDWEKSLMKKNPNDSYLLPEKYGEIYLYYVDNEKRYSIDYDKINIVK